MKHEIEIVTLRLKLVGANTALLRAQLAGDAELALALQADVPSAWPPEHIDPPTIEWALAQVRGLSDDAIWRMYYIVLCAPRAVAIGTCGFKGPPDAQRMVEVGYSVLPEYQRHGFASEATAALIDAAYRAGAAEVIAETLPHLTASRRVMEKCGMQLIGAGSEEGVILYRHQRVGIN